jgi:hypothetical protein
MFSYRDVKAPFVGVALAIMLCTAQGEESPRRSHRATSHADMSFIIRRPTPIIPMRHARNIRHDAAETAALRRHCCTNAELF